MASLTVWKFPTAGGAEQALDVVDRLADTFKGAHAELIASNLSQAQEAKLHEVFGTTPA